ncbi:MAG: MFS transporter [Anaerolineales bacterium]|nr:MFS transporter [Anaerolineales bacterium]
MLLTETTPIVPRQRQVFRRVWVATFLCFAAFYGITQPLAEVLGRSAFDVGATSAVLGAFGVTALLARPLAGWLSDRLAPRWILGLGAVALAVGVLGMIWETGVEGLILLRGLQALGYAAFTTAGTAWVARLGESEQRAGRLARFGMAANAAMAVVPALIGSILLSVSSTGVLLGLGGIALAAGLCAQITAPMDGSAPGNGSIARRDHLDAVVRGVGLRPWLLALLIGLGFGVFLQYAPLLATGGGKGLFTVYGVTILLTRAVGGRWLDRRALATVARLAGGALAVGMMGLWAGGLAGWFGAAAIGVGGGMLHPAVLAAAVKRFPAAPGLATGWCYVGFDLGLALSGWALGPVFGSGGAGMVFALTGVVMLGAVWLGGGCDDRNRVIADGR